MTAKQPHTSAAMSDDVARPVADARARLLWGLIVTATLPRVWFSLLLGGANALVLPFSDVGWLLSPLRALGFLCDIASLIIVARLHVLDEGDEPVRRWRWRAIVVGMAALLVPTVGSIIVGASFDYGSHYVFVGLHTIPATAALATLGLWLGALLRRYQRTGLLVWVAGIWLPVMWMPYFGFRYVAFAGVVVGALTAFEIERVRRAVSHA